MAAEQNPLQLAKITKQWLPEIYHRERLYKLLDEGREYPAFWISGPAGSGKTTLVSGYIESRNIPCIWYQTDQGDTDIATFFHYMGLAVRRASPGKHKEALPHLSAQYTVDTPTFTLRYFEKLFKQINPNSAIVLDNYQEVHADSSLHEIIYQALCAIPEGYRFFILSREAPPAVFSRLRANRIMKSIRWEDIRLTVEETEKIACLKVGQQLPESLVTSLHSVTDGWVAGLILMLLSTSAEDKAAGRINKQKPNEIFDYFTREVFDAINPETRDILLKTALLPNMTIPMAERLTGQTLARKIIPRLYQNHMFIEKRHNRKTFYQYHQLFREFMQNRLEEICSEKDFNKLRREAAVILEEDGQIEAAISLLSDSGYWEDSAALVIKHAGSLLSQGRTRPLARWLGQLPAELMDEKPWLIYWMGACHMSSDPLAARSCFEKAFERFKALGDRTGLLLAWAGVVESVFYRFEDMSILNHWISLLEALLKENRTFPTEDVETRVVFSMFSALVFHQPHHPEASFWADRAMELADVSNDVGSKAYAYAQLIYYHTMMGHIDKMSAIMESIGRMKMTAETDPLARINVLAVETFYFLGKRAHDKCLKTAFEGLEVARKSGVNVRDLLFLGWGAWSALAANDLKTVEDFLDQFSSNLSHLKPYENTFYYFLRSWEAEIKGDFHRAAYHADLSLEILHKFGVPINICILLLSKAQAMHGLGRVKEAKHNLEEAIVVAEKTGSGLLKYGALTFKAKMELDRGEEESALASLRDAMSFGKKNGYSRKIMTYPPITARLCAKALEADIEVDYVQDLIRRQGLAPEKTSWDIQAWPWPIKVFTLGRFELIIDGKPFSYSGRAPHKPLSLLKVLIALGGKEIGEIRIQDALWPDMEGDGARNIFSTTLHRLRKILGHEKAIVLSQGRVSLNAEYCWVDIRFFHNKLEAANREWDKGEPGGEKSVELLSEAVAMYKGTFLPDDDAPWVIPLCERMSNGFERCINRIGKYYTKTNQMDKAVHCYTKALEIDPLMEDFYRFLMACYSKLGKRSQVKRTYLRCRENLSKTLGIEPSPETKALYQGLS